MRQKALTLKLHKHVLSELREHDDERTAAFRSLLKLPGTKDWLGCAPAPGLKTHIRARDFRIWLKFWCRLPLFKEGQRCHRQGCRAKHDVFGDHLLACTHAVSPVKRAHDCGVHDALVRLTTAELSRAKRRPVPEYRDVANGRSRPDIRCLGVAGGTDFLELSITHPLGNAQSRKLATNSPASVLALVENKKFEQHREVVMDPSSDTNVVVFAMTSVGGYCEAMRDYLKDLYRDRAPEEGNSATWETRAGFQRFAVRLLEGNVQCLSEGINCDIEEVDERRDTEPQLTSHKSKT